MTTTVQIHYPTPNHKHVKVLYQNKLPDGSWGDGEHYHILTSESNHLQNYIWGDRRIILEEEDEKTT